MILYFLKSLVLLGIFYATYLLFLKNLKSFRWNRRYLVLTGLVSILMPFLNQLLFIEVGPILKENNPVTHTLESINIYANAVDSRELDFAKILMGIYLAGLIWGLLRVVLGFLVIRRIKLGAQLEIHKEHKVYFNEQIETPFSFNKQIFIPLSFKDKAVLDVVMQHEMAHVQMHHSRDKIFFSLLQAIFWYNPFIYLYHRELELIHEFEADEFTTKKIVTDQYVQNLLQTVNYQQTPTLLVHHFFHHPLKTRITMLYKKSTNTMMQKSIVVILTLLICICTFLMQGFAQSKTSPQKLMVDKSRYDTIDLERPDGTVERRIIDRGSADDGNNNQVYESVDQLPEFKGGAEALIKYIQENLRYPDFEAKNSIEGKVLVRFTVDRFGKVKDVKTVQIPSKGENLSKEAIRVVENMPLWEPGQKDGLPVNVGMTIPIQFKLK